MLNGSALLGFIIPLQLVYVPTPFDWYIEIKYHHGGNNELRKYGTNRLDRLHIFFKLILH